MHSTAAVAATATAAATAADAAASGAAAAAAATATVTAAATAATAAAVGNLLLLPPLLPPTPLHLFCLLLLLSCHGQFLIHSYFVLCIQLRSLMNDFILPLESKWSSESKSFAVSYEYYHKDLTQHAHRQ